MFDLLTVFSIAGKELVDLLSGSDEDFRIPGSLVLLHFTQLVVCRDITVVDNQTRPNRFPESESQFQQNIEILQRKLVGESPLPRNIVIGLTWQESILHRKISRLETTGILQD